MEVHAGTVAVVTGASAGMGRAIALRLRREGAALALCDVNAAALESLRAECEAMGAAGAVSTHRVDVGSRDALRRFAEEVAAAHGPAVHMLFNNAGIVVPGATARPPALSPGGSLRPPARGTLGGSLRPLLCCRRSSAPRTPRRTAPLPTAGRTPCQARGTAWSRRASTRSWP